jgi:hypothetical protein
MKSVTQNPPLIFPLTPLSILCEFSTVGRFGFVKSFLLRCLNSENFFVAHERYVGFVETVTLLQLKQKLNYKRALL